MKNPKNHSVIFGLALTLLFFSACGKKDNTDETKLPSLTNIKATSLPQNSIKDNSPGKAETENEILRPVIVTILENGLPSHGATASIEYYGTKPSDWTAKTDKNGTAKILIPEKLSSFHLSAVKDGYATVLFYTNRLVKGVTPVHVELNLDEPGAVITAQLIADKEIDENNISARLVHDDYKMGNHLRVATSTACKDKKITFPPVKELKGVKVMVKAKGFADSYSEHFNVRSGEDKTVYVKLLSDVKFRGKAIRSDGVVISNLHFQATPRGLYEEQNNPGHVGINKNTDEDGYFNVAGLLAEHYKLYLETDEAQWIITNVVLFPGEENYMEFIFPEFKYKNVNGIVIYEQSGEPAAGIEIKCYTHNLGRSKSKIITTDKNGKFNVSLPVTVYFRAELVINEPGFAKIEYRVQRNINKPITLMLRETGILTGRVATKSGKPISGVRVNIRPAYDSSKLLGTRKVRWDENAAYGAADKNSSDSDGIYVISNAAAPQAYSVNAYGGEDYFLPGIYDKKVKIEPGQTTVHNITMFQRPVVMVQLKDENGKPVLKYSLLVKTKNNSGSGGRTHSVKLYDNDDWYKFNILRHNKAKLSLHAESEDRRVAEKKNITVDLGKTYKIILHLSNSVPPTVSGFVYKPDMTPHNLYVRARVGRQEMNGQCDHLGFFEIIGMDVEKGTKLKLSTSYKNVGATTNVLAGDNNIEWILSEPKRIRGRVCIEDINTPATNFAVSIYRSNHKKDFHSENGEFSLLPGEHYTKWVTKINVFVFVPGYAPEISEFKLQDPNTYDIGNIIVKNKPATIAGRVIDHEYNPVSARVILKRKDEKSTGFLLRSENDKTDGTFEFSDLPKGKYIVEAHTQLKNLKSELFELRSGENYTLPDLMVVETNAVLVLFKFVLPDGSPAANARVNYFTRLTDKNGHIEKMMVLRSPITYDKLKLRIEDKFYYAEKIEINKNTRNITVNLIQLPDITGTVTLGGKPLDSAKLTFQGDGNYYQSYAYDGKFEVEAKPGKYTVICSDKKTAAIVELSESDPNIINFKSGNGTFEFVYPVKGDWGINFSTKLNNRYVNILNLNAKEDDNGKITELPAGEYSIHAYCHSVSFYTNISVKTTLQPNETKKINF